MRWVLGSGSRDNDSDDDVERDFLSLRFLRGFILLLILFLLSI
jgi:hypothetical protein